VGERVRKEDSQLCVEKISWVISAHSGESIVDFHEISLPASPRDNVVFLCPTFGFVWVR
jgi:hypothetical protein